MRKSSKTECCTCHYKNLRAVRPEGVLFVDGAKEPQFEDVANVINIAHGLGGNRIDRTTGSPPSNSTWRIVAIMAKKLLLTLALIPPLLAQEPLATHAPVPLQPLAQQVRRLETALNYLGQPLLPADRKEINEAISDADEIAAVKRLE